MNHKFSGFLDFVRWLAALLVVLQHIRTLWFTDFVNVQNQSLLIKFFYFISGFGTEAVIVFFVLSGFLVGGGAMSKWRNNIFSASDYFIRRFSRIYTVLIPALIIGGLLDWCGLHYFNATEIYTNSQAYHTKLLNFSIESYLDWPTFMANLFNLQKILASHFGSNGPLWSLAYEWWYYCLFGLFITMLDKKITLPTLLKLTSLLAISILLLPLHMLLYMVIWGMGVLLAMLDTSRYEFLPRGGILLFIVVLIGSRLFHILLDGRIGNSPNTMLIQFISHIVLASGFAALMITQRNQTWNLWPSTAFHKRMADFSYTTYLLHVPLLVFITAILSSAYAVEFVSQPNGQTFLIAACLLVVLYLSLYLISQLTERHTARVRAYLARQLTPNQYANACGRS